MSTLPFFKNALAMNTAPSTPHVDLPPASEATHRSDEAESQLDAESSAEGISDEDVHPGPQEPSPLEVARERATEALAVSRAWIIANPAAALGIAVGTGFLIGRMVRR